MIENFKYKTLSCLQDDEDAAASNLIFSIICKNSSKEHQYDLRNITKKEYESILVAFSKAIYRQRNSVGHLSREKGIHAIRLFFEYIDTLNKHELVVYQLAHIDERILSNFAQWLKRYSNLKYTTAAGCFSLVGSLFRRIYDLHGVHPSLRVPASPFPNKHRMSTPVLGYTEDIYKDIIKAVANELRSSSKTLERKYVPKWLSEAAPIEDIADFPKDGEKNFRPSLWKTHEYRIWWWENNCSCLRLNAAEIQKIPQGGTFYKSFSNSKRKGGAIANLNRFYDEIGAGTRYVPKYLNSPCPVIYLSRWEKHAYAHWYWENVLQMSAPVHLDLKRNATSFLNGIQRYHGGPTDFFNSIDISFSVSVADLIPYYIMLLVRTALNPTTIASLTIDCLVQDPTDSSRWMIQWTKSRAFKTGRTIPSSLENDNWSASIVRRVIEITARFRKPGQLNLWVTSWQNGRDRSDGIITPQAFRYGLKAFVEKHKLTDSATSDGSFRPLSIHVRKFRPTIAMLEYVRTEDLLYIQEMLGHKHARMTASYIGRTGDPILRLRRGLHQQAMLVGLTEGENTKRSLMERLHISKEVATSLLSKGGENDGLLNHCVDPKHSPYSGQTKGKICNAAADCCLSCQNLVITPEDIIKFFCYENYHASLLRIGLISDMEHERALAEKRIVWRTHILPRYDAAVIERCRLKAETEPLPEWSISCPGEGNG